MTTAATTHLRRSRATTTVLLLALLIAATTITSPAALAAETRVRDSTPGPAAIVGNITADTPTGVGNIGVHGYDNTAASTVATNGLGKAGALRNAAVEVHDLATPAIRHNMSTVAVMEAEIPGAGTQFFAAGSSGRLSAAQIARLQELGVPAENILRGPLHAELNILNGLPEGATPIRWGVAWAGGNKPIPCASCAPFVQGIIEGAP